MGARAFPRSVRCGARVHSHPPSQPLSQLSSQALRVRTSAACAGASQAGCTARPCLRARGRSRACTPPPAVAATVPTSPWPSSSGLLTDPLASPTLPPGGAAPAPRTTTTTTTRAWASLVSACAMPYGLALGTCGRPPHTMDACVMTITATRLHVLASLQS